MDAHKDALTKGREIWNIKCKILAETKKNDKTLETLLHEANERIKKLDQSTSVPNVAIGIPNDFKRPN